MQASDGKLDDETRNNLRTRSSPRYHLFEKRIIVLSALYLMNINDTMTSTCNDYENR
jgi:hypothetical protein